MASRAQLVFAYYKSGALNLKLSMKGRILSVDGPTTSWTFIKQGALM